MQADNSPAAVQVTFNNPVKYGKQKELFIAPEGMYTGQARSWSFCLL